MYDFHMHSRISFDCEAEPEDMLRAAVKAGLKEICFTDHVDYDPQDWNRPLRFEMQDYSDAYDHLQAEGLKIRRGFEFGMLANNVEEFHRDVKRREFDFVIGSMHFADGCDPYFDAYWEGKTMDQAEITYFNELLECVRVHDDFDVLGHLTFVSKAWANPTKRPILYDTYRDVADEIMKLLVAKGKGMEINTSGMDSVGDFLPSAAYFKRFKELGGEIITVGADAHTPDRVGQYCKEACQLAADIFGYVCTFERRVPIFHKL